MKRFTRRNFLRGVGASTLALPILPSLLSAKEVSAKEANRAKNLILMFSPNGSIPERWTPSGSENNWSINANDILTPLIPVKDDILVIEGVDMFSARYGIGDGHQTGMGHMLTGTELLPGPFPGGGNVGPAGYAGGISVDQYIAGKLGVDALTLAIKAGRPTNWSRMSYTGGDQPVNPHEDPTEIFNKLFGNIDKNTVELKTLLEQRRSVLDFVKGDLDRIKTKVASTDLHRIHGHLASIRKIEKSLISANENGICETPNLGKIFDHKLDKNFPHTGKILMDMIVKSLECGLTQVASLQFSRSVGGANFGNFLNGVNRGHHDLSHDTDSNSIEQMVKINRWYAEQMVYLMEKLKAVRYDDGTTLFDNTTILWVNELGRGSTHTRNNVPYVLAGSCGGYFNLGRFIESDDEPHNNMLLSLCHAMGVKDSSFGNPDYCTGVLKNLT